MLGGIRGISGQYLPTRVSTFTKVEDNTVCDPVFFQKLHAKSEELLNLLDNKNQLVVNPSSTWINLYSLSIIRNSPLWTACSNYLDSLVTAEYSDTVQEVAQCPYATTDPRYEENSCCSRISAWDTVCTATPANVSAPKVYIR